MSGAWKPVVEWFKANGGAPKKTPWGLTGSEDQTVSLVLSGSSGRLVLVNSETQQKMTLAYKCLSLGLSKGAPVGYSESTDRNAGAAFGPVTSYIGFGPQNFPCMGSIGSFGGTLGMLRNSDSANGVAVQEIAFGLAPAFAFLRFWGTSQSTTPGAGISAGPAWFSLEN